MGQIIVLSAAIVMTLLHGVGMAIEYHQEGIPSIGEMTADITALVLFAYAAMSAWNAMAGG